MDQFWQELSSLDPQYEGMIKSLNFEIQDGRLPPFWKNTDNAIIRKRFDRLPPNFNPMFASAPRTRFGGQKLIRRPPIEIYKYGNNVETAWPKWTNFGRNHPFWILNVKFHQKFDFRNPRWPPAAILKNTKKISLLIFLKAIIKQQILM